ncbi:MULTISPECIES: DUF2946 family protein [unclassified Ruegeria]|uniref:DUF2946 family protein n=1 Tax=unclassified Ruegeria TaxID=2625375 RepID=UPI001AD99D3A|nr:MULTISPECIES: DUF2946 family protein [unclassified Ruegeria]MBO9411699.1 hypothetical protein [Ruegeria sp. R8_1]MBO9415739.1 hypothetical protein [Ruegeria sp. R8_2]
MPVSNPLHNLPVRASRVACAWAGILLLLLQTLGPVLASPGQSMWVEICSEAGAVWVQVDLEEGTKDPTAPCPKCADCALCAVTTLAPLPDLPHLVLSQKTDLAQCQFADQFQPHDQTRLWPESRGPPRAPQETTERALRASVASTLKIGGAPWS